MDPKVVGSNPTSHPQKGKAQDKCPSLLVYTPTPYPITEKDLLGGCHAQGTFDHKKNPLHLTETQPYQKNLQKKCILRVTFPFFCD